MAWGSDLDQTLPAFLAVLVVILISRRPVVKWNRWGGGRSFSLDRKWVPGYKLESNKDKKKYPLSGHTIQSMKG